MKKILFIVLVAVTTIGFNKSVTAQLAPEGTFLVDFYVGFPDFYKTVLQTTYANSYSVDNISFSGVLPVGGKIEYLLSDVVGIGLDVNYKSTDLSYRDYTTNSVGDPIVYSYSVARSVFRVLPRVNFHYGKAANFEGFSGVGVGYRLASWKIDSNDPNFKNKSFMGVNPVAFRLFSGMRYFFTDAIGLNLELGFGGGTLLQGGLSIKI